MVVAYLRVLRRERALGVFFTDDAVRHCAVIIPLALVAAVVGREWVGQIVSGQWGRYCVVVLLICCGAIISETDAGRRYFTRSRLGYLKYLGFSSKDAGRLMAVLLSAETSAWGVATLILGSGKLGWWVAVVGAAVVVASLVWLPPIMVARRASPLRTARSETMIIARSGRYFSRGRSIAQLQKDIVCVGRLAWWVGVLGSLVVGVAPLALLWTFPDAVRIMYSLILTGFLVSVMLFQTETGATAVFFRRRYGLSTRAVIRHKTVPVTAIMVVELLLGGAVLSAWQGFSLTRMAVGLVAGLAAWMVVVSCLWCFGWRVSLAEPLDDLTMLLVFVAALVPIVAVVIGVQANRRVLKGEH